MRLAVIISSICMAVAMAAPAQPICKFTVNQMMVSTSTDLYFLAIREDSDFFNTLEPDMTW